MPHFGYKKLNNKSRVRHFAGGYMTVFLTLVMTVLLSLCLTLIEGARSNAVRLESYVAASISLESVMAEYHRELAKQFNIFAIEDSYGTATASLSNTENHLAGYLDKNFDSSDFLLSSFLYRDFMSISASKSEVEGVSYLSDEDGGVFRRRAYEAMKDDCGVTLLSELQDYVTYIEENELEERDLSLEIDSLKEEIKDVDFPEYSGPYSLITENRSFSKNNPMILYHMVEDVGSLSDKQIDLSGIFSERKKRGLINEGNLKLENTDNIQATLERFVFDEYLLRYMGSYRNEDESDALRYQIEYILSGNASDTDNLIGVVGRILGIRFVADFMYLVGDEEKCRIAEAMATVISVVTYTEGFIDIYKALILLIWAQMEAEADVRCLMAGSRVEMIKTKENWRTDLGQLFDPKDTSGDETGLSYQDYLRIFLLMTNEKVLTARAMDMVEADIRETPGNKDFRIDACIDEIAVYIETRSKFGYTTPIHLRRKYE